MKNNIYIIFYKFSFIKKNILLSIFILSYILSKLNTKNYLIDIFNQLSFQILLSGILLLFILIFLKKIWATLVCFVICVLLAINILPSCKHCNALLKDEAQINNKIRLMTFNTSYAIDKNLPKWFLYLEKMFIKNKNPQLIDLRDLYELVLSENPDIIQFQEVTPKVKDKLKSFESIFPYSIALSKFVGIAESIIFSKYPFVQNENNNSDAVLTKIAVEGIELNIIGAHFYSGIDQNRFNLAEKQMTFFKTLIQNINQNLILIGDLNMTPISKRFINFLQETNLYTYTSYMNPTFTWPAYLPKYFEFRLTMFCFQKILK